MCDTLQLCRLFALLTLSSTVHPPLPPNRPPPSLHWTLIEARTWENPAGETGIPKLGGKNKPDPERCHEFHQAALLPLSHQTAWPGRRFLQTSRSLPLALGLSRIYNSTHAFAEVENTGPPTPTTVNAAWRPLPTHGQESAWLV